jgi:hypothetical protein
MMFFFQMPLSLLIIFFTCFETLLSFHPTETQNARVTQAPHPCHRMSLRTMESGRKWGMGILSV